MIEQEHIYQLVFSENWGAIIKILHKHKNTIATDPMIRFAAETFESEFLKKVSTYPVEQTDIANHLEDLFILHRGGFYQLKSENYKTLLTELGKRKSGDDGQSYLWELKRLNKASIEPTTDQPQIVAKSISKPKPQIITENWIEVYNRLFDLINVQGDTATYFSGPKFINVVKEFKPFFADYTQYIDKRNQEGKSTSRKIFYYDILNELDITTRTKVIDRILELTRPFENNKVVQIEVLLGKEAVNPNIDAPKKSEAISKKNPVVFISYSWDNEAHKTWVLQLADSLVKDGIYVILDQYELRPGRNLPHFVEQSIVKADKILIIFTPNYKLKADKRSGGVGYEYSIMNSELYRNQTNNEKVIPILRLGDQQASIPTFMQQFIHLDMTNSENFDNSYADLKREVCDEPAIRRPTLGARPVFSVDKELIPPHG